MSLDEGHDIHKETKLPMFKMKVHFGSALFASHTSKLARMGLVHFLPIVGEAATVEIQLR